MTFRIVQFHYSRAVSTLYRRAFSPGYHPEPRLRSDRGHLIDSSQSITMDAIQFLPHPYQLSTVSTGTKHGYTSSSSSFSENDRETQSQPQGQGQSLPSIREVLNDSYLSLFIPPASRQAQQAQQSHPLVALSNLSTRGGPRGPPNSSSNGLEAQFERGHGTSCQPRLPETFRSMIPVTGQTSTDISLPSLDSSKSLEAMESSIIGSEMMPGRDNKAVTPTGGEIFPNGPASSPQVVRFQWLIPPSTPTTSTTPTTPYVHHGVQPCVGTLWKSRAPESVGVQNPESELPCPSESTQRQDESSNSQSGVYKVHASLNEVCDCH
jgi:hypothetical protein